MNNEVKPKVILETIICYKGVKYNTLLKITAKEMIFKKKPLFSNKYKTVERVLINDILLKKDKARIILDRNDITILTKDDDIKFSAENKQEAKRIVEIVYSLRTGRKYVGEKDTGSAIFKIIRNTLAIGGAIVVTTGAYKAIKKYKKKHNL